MTGSGQVFVSETTRYFGVAPAAAWKATFHSWAAPGADIEAIGEALDDGEGLPSPSTRYLLCRAGGVVLDERFAAPRLGPERLGHGPVPEIMPLLRHRATDVRYLVVETGREGAQVRVQRATRAARESAQEIQGRTDSLPKVQAGGWSHLRYQKHSEKIWAQNQGEVAAVVERLVREREPRFVVIAGRRSRRRVRPSARGSRRSASFPDSSHLEHLPGTMGSNSSMPRTRSAPAVTMRSITGRLRG
ncbi:hypothetical protein USB125703_01957 [Pseudoclavibacter triregionum]|nr:hypothetical protein USB125703_01957 [Pseudoclavibacter triregionum]